jgi:hypothetical protein
MGYQNPYRPPASYFSANSAATLGAFARAGRPYAGGSPNVPISFLGVAFVGPGIRLLVGRGGKPPPPPPPPPAPPFAPRVATTETQPPADAPPARRRNP